MATPVYLGMRNTRVSSFKPESDAQFQFAIKDNCESYEAITD